MIEPCFAFWSEHRNDEYLDGPRRRRRGRCIGARLNEACKTGANKNPQQFVFIHKVLLLKVAWLDSPALCLSAQQSCAYAAGFGSLCADGQANGSLLRRERAISTAHAKSQWAQMHPLRDCSLDHTGGVSLPCRGRQRGSAAGPCFAPRCLDDAGIDRRERRLEMGDQKVDEGPGARGLVSLAGVVDKQIG